MSHNNRAYRIFTIFNYIGLSLLALTCIFPMIHILAVSFSGKAAATANLVTLWPVDFTLEAYEKTLTNEYFLRSLGIAVLRTVLGTAITMALVFLTAYPLSKAERSFKGRSFYAWFFVFTMLFNGGLVPTYILVQNLGIMNTIWALVLPMALNVWLIILMLNFFRTIPKELEEAAFIDGAGQLKTMAIIYLPLSMPAIATLALFAMVFNWNEWFTGLIYMSDRTKYPLATFLQTVIVQNDLTQISRDPAVLENISQRTVKAAQIFIGAIPILMVYPFLQKYFVKGIVLGAVKE
ncbi:carbohydrate ABC transporter permease [Paenibacillus sp. 1P07SE]|uniref:carbohydrate ABC transporter permease n=1 Tax=Paenibacillus sp. 1P07SE TaxID=3132209 RepID=UPI0039A6C458